MIYLNITLDTLKKIKQTLPAKSYQLIQDETNFTQAYISRFFDGDYKVSDGNYSIIRVARKILRQQINRVANIENTLKQA